MKKINNKEDFLIILGIAFFLAGFFMIFLQLLEPSISSSILSFGITLIIISIFRKRRLKKYPQIQDERIKKLSMYGLGYSWITTFLVIIIFFWFDYFNLVNVNTQQYYSIIFVTMILSAIVFQRLLYKKGDVE